jgi:hypothetical protein
MAIELDPKMLQDTVLQVQEIALAAWVKAQNSGTSLESKLRRLVEHLRIRGEHSHPELQNLNHKLDEIISVLMDILSRLPSVEKKLSALNLSSFVSTKVQQGNVDLHSAVNLAPTSSSILSLPGLLLLLFLPILIQSQLG